MRAEPLLNIVVINKKVSRRKPLRRTHCAVGRTDDLRILLFELSSVSL